jgi:mannose-1-phosphate guanylyltransferase
MAVRRLLPAYPLDRITVVTIQSQVGQLLEQVPELTMKNLIVEPAPRGTASVIGLAAVALRRRDPQATMACLTADHLIENQARFLAVLEAGASVAARGGLVTLGITPTHPSTAYGYIHVGEPEVGAKGFQVRRVLRFVEKPEGSVAEQYVTSGDYFWNSGMFVWTVDAILEQFRRWMPDLYQVLQAIAEDYTTPAGQVTLDRLWGSLASQTIDYGIMEHAPQVSVIGGDDLGWSDVGGWDRLFDLLPVDADGNLIRAENALLVDSVDSLVYQDPPGHDRRLIAGLGLRDLVVVDTPDVLLVCRKDRAEAVRALVKELAASGRGQYL